MARLSNTKEKGKTGVLYLCAAVFLLSVGLSFLLPAGGSIYSYGMIVQFASLVIPAALYNSISGEKALAGMKISLFSPAKTVFLLLFAVAIFCGSLLLSLIFGSETGTSAGVSGEPYSVALLCMAILPAFAEELFFRGMVMSELEHYGPVTAVTLSSLLFAMFHFSLEGLPVYFFCGLMLALCAYVTRSVLASCAVHLVYNLTVMLGAEKIRAFFAITDDITLIAVVLAVILLVCLILIFGECQRTYEIYSEQNALSPRKGVTGAGGFFSALLSPASAACIIIFAAALLI